jgi:hypothetical protein
MEKRKQEGVPGEDGSLLREDRTAPRTEERGVEGRLGV